MTGPVLDESVDPVFSRAARLTTGGNTIARAGSVAVCHNCDHFVPYVISIGSLTLGEDEDHPMLRGPTQHGDPSAAT